MMRMMKRIKMMMRMMMVAFVKMKDESTNVDVGVSSIRVQLLAAAGGFDGC